MLCPRCGIEIELEADFCPFCGCEFDSNKLKEDFEKDIKTNAQKFIKDAQFEIKLSKWNWGACIYGLLWGIYNGALRITLLITIFYITLICILFYTGIPSVSSMLLLMHYLLGSNGTKWAWNGSKKWICYEEFEHCQNLWNEHAKKYSLPFIVFIIFLVYNLALIFDKNDILSPHIKSIMDTLLILPFK